MKGLLLDQGLPRSTTRLLIESGFAALHAADVGLSRASDPEILEYARVRDLVVVTLDADFLAVGYSIAAAETKAVSLRVYSQRVEHAFQACTTAASSWIAL